MNRSDSEEMAGALLAAGCAEAPALEAADLVVINSCAIREAAEQKVIGRMGALARLREARPGLRVVLTGCAVRADNQAVLRRRYPAVDLFLRPDEEPELVARLGLASATSPGVLGGDAGLARVGRSVAATADRLPATRAPRWGRGASPVAAAPRPGCRSSTAATRRAPTASCPSAAARSAAARSTTWSTRRAAWGREGYREVTLLGQNVNSYGHDLPPDTRFAALQGERQLGRRLDLEGRPDIAALLRAIDGLRTADGRPAIPRLRFITSHPWDLTERLIAAMAECPSVCEHLHLPVQSGSDAVLRRMGRQYTVASYLELVARLRAAIPGISLTTDVIVGFCGETEAQFEATLDLLRTVGYDQVYAAAFSPRPGTPAARLPDDVPPAEKHRRLTALLDLQEALGLARQRAWLGRTTEVLVEAVRPARSHTHGDSAEGTPLGEGITWLSGRNRENRLVHVAGSPDLVGSFVTVTVEHAGPYALRGRLA